MARASARAQDRVNDWRVNDWFAGALARDLLTHERRRCEQLLPAGYYARSLQVGLPMLHFAENLNVEHAFVMASAEEHQHALEHPARQKLDAVAEFEAMPFGEKSCDLIFLPHALDFCRDPHAVLREVAQILAPEGCVAVTGFNALSLWGAVRLFKRRAAKSVKPWSGRYHGARRVQDWLALLGFDLVGARMLGYRPPLQNEKWRGKLLFMEAAGERWWPVAGAAYVIVARKREPLVRGGRVFAPWRRLVPGLARPALVRADNQTHGQTRRRIKITRNQNRKRIKITPCTQITGVAA